MHLLFLIGISALLSCLVNISHGQGFNQKENPQFRTLHWGADEGLAFEKTYCMLKDKYGFLWIGTEEGLSRFDGSVFKNYSYDPVKKNSLMGNQVLGLVEDSLHNIWIGSQNGLTRYDIRADSFTHIVKGESSGKTTGTMIPFGASADEIFCLEDNSLITSYQIHNLKKRILVHLIPKDNLNPSPYARVSSLYDAQSNSAWLLNSWKGDSSMFIGGMLKISLSDGRKEHFEFPPGKISDAHPASEVIRLDRNRNAIWILLHQGLLKFSLADHQFHKAEFSGPIQPKDWATVGMDIDTKGRIWLNSFSEGLLIYEPADSSLSTLFANDSKLKEDISLANSYLFCDRDGLAWAGSWLRRGIFEIIPFSPPVTRYWADTLKNGTYYGHAIYNCILSDSGKVWMGSADEGLVEYYPVSHNIRSRSVNEFRGLAGHHSIIPVNVDTVAQKAVIMATDPNLLYILDIRSRKCIPVDFRDRNGAIVKSSILEVTRSFNGGCIARVLSGDSVRYFLLSAGKTEASEIFSFDKDLIEAYPARPNINPLPTDGMEYLFIKSSALSGSLTYQYSQETWKQVHTPFDSLDWSNIVKNTGDLSWWVYVPGHLYHYDHQFKIIDQYSEENGLPDQEIYVMIPDHKGNLWFNNNRFIYFLNAGTGFVNKLSEKDGFRAADFRNAFEGLKTENGDLYFPGSGTWQGFTVVSPDRYAITPSLLYLKSVKIKDAILPPEQGANSIDSLDVKYFQNRISIETGNIDYYSQGRGSIRYQIEGRGGVWQYAPANYTIRFEELPVGHYTLLMQAGNASGDFTGPVKTIFIRINPAFWNTWWFRILVIFMLLGIAFFTMRRVIRQRFYVQLEKSEKETQLAEMRQRTAQLQKQASDLEMQALRAQMNPHFIFNSLNSINRFILQNDRLQASEFLTKFSRLVRMILQNSQSSLISLESELESLSLYLELEALRFEQRFEFKISVPSDLDISDIQVPPLIIQPYAENAIWHGLMHKEEKGQLDIEVSEEENHLCVKVADNGIGRKQSAILSSKSATKHKSMGLKITANRIAMLESSNGKEEPVTIYDLENEDGTAAGTEVVIKMPLIYS